MDTAKLKDDTMDLADQDYYGLYEIVWTLNSWYPEVSETEKILCARSLAEELVNSGAYEMYRTDEWPPVTYSPVLAREARTVIQNDDAFRVPPGKQSAILFWITRKN